MKQDPLFSGEVFKAILLFIVALAIGGAAVAVATGGLDIDLPDIDLPDVDTTGTTTNLTDTSLSNTTIDGPQEATPDEPEVPEEPAEEPVPATEAIDPFTSAGLAQAIDRIWQEAGPGLRITHLLINDVQIQLSVLAGKEVKAYSVRSDGTLTKSDVTVTITGNATIDDFAFPVGAIHPPVIDSMLERARQLSRAADFRPSTISLDRDLSGGLSAPSWTLNAQGNGRYLTFRARLDGRHLENVGGKGIQIPKAP